MKKKTANLTIIVLLITYITLSFIPCLIARDASILKGDGGVVSHNSPTVETFFSQFTLDIMGSTFMPKLAALIAIVTTCLVIAGIAGFGLMLLEKENNKILALAPCGAIVTHFIAAFILFAFEPSFYSPESNNTYITTFAPMWGFYVQSTILIMAVSLIILMMLDKFEDEPIKTVNTSKSDTIDSLKKYKELLDCGIITQEEFDAKKKQVLGL